MPIIALIRLRGPRELIQVYPSVPASVPIPGVGTVSPPSVGWRGGGEITYQDDGNGGQVAVEGPARYAIVEVTPGNIQTGHRVIGANYTLNEDDSVIQSLITEAIPQPTPSVIDALIADVDDLKARVSALEGG